MMMLARTDERRRADEIQFRLIYMATLPAFLVSTLVARAFPAKRRARDPRSSLTILGEAKAAASTCGSYALMG